MYRDKTRFKLIILNAFVKITKQRQIQESNVNKIAKPYNSDEYT